MRVLHLISSAGYYGAETMLATLAQALPSVGWETVVGVFDNPRASNIAVLDELQSLGVTVLRIRCSGRIDLGSIGVIRRSIEEHLPDVIHTHGYKADIYGYFATRKIRVSIVSTCHNWPSKRPTVRLYYSLDRAVLRNFDKIAAVSDNVARLLRTFGIADSKVQVIYNGIDVDKFVQPPHRPVPGLDLPTGFKVGVVGRLAREKGYEYLLKAAQQLANPDLMVIFVGEGPEKESIESCAAELGISDRVFLCGHRSDMPDIYASLDAVVLPSLNEGMPMTILEAMAAGKPVIATAVGAVDKAVISGRTGLLVQPGNADALCGALREMIANPSLRRNLAVNGQRWVREHFSAGVMANKYSELYQAALDRGRRAN